jgi:adenylate cyclase
VTALRDLRHCFEGAVPAVIATAGADGTPNVTYLSRVLLVDDERVALSNQFFSKTSTNLAENPQANVLVLDPTSFDQYRLHLAYERTERRGPVFERLREEIAAIAALVGMASVFKLRAADIYRVVELDLVPSSSNRPGDPAPARQRREPVAVAAIAEVTRRLARARDLDTLVTTAVRALAEVCGYQHSLLLLLDEEGQRLYTVASHGYEVEGVGSEVQVGQGIVGLAAARAVPVRVGNVRQMQKYSTTVRRAFEDQGAIAPAASIPLPGLPGATSQVAVPALVGGQLVAVLLVEHLQPVAFDENDEHVLQVVAAIVAQAVEAGRTAASDEDDQLDAVPSAPAASPDGPATLVRFFPVDGSTFLDGDYLIKGVAGRILWSLVRQHVADGRVDFTNRELRLDASLELPPHRSNLESRLLLLQRRLEERAAPVQIERAARGRFQLRVTSPLRLETVDES